MTDVVDRATRSRMMSAIRGANTQPERAVRSGLHRAGLRFRLNVRTLLGTPDIVLPRWRSVVFVHGCFWHRHTGCRFSTMPSTNTAFWRSKFRTNVARDKRNATGLRREGWTVHTLWACEITPARIERLTRLIRGHKR